jgi:hypothetical protein
MNYGGISLDAYVERGDGANLTSMQDVDELNKALQATELRGGATEGSATASGAPLKVESLEKTLKVVTFSQKNIVMWKETPVLPAYNTVEEYNRLTSYGSDQGGFTTEGELPEEDDAVYIRESQLVKYMGTTRIITHPMTLVNTAHGAVIEREINNGTIWLLAKLERALFEGNSDIVPQEVNGIYAQMQKEYATEVDFLNSEQVLDMRGYRLDDVSLEQASNTIIENYGFPSDIFWTPRAGSDYAKNFYPRTRTLTPVGLENQRSGMRITSFVSQAGEIPFHPDVFMRPKSTKTTASLATSVKAPAPPVIDGSAPIAPVGATVANAKWDSGIAGTYFYAVSTLNRFGESALSTFSNSLSTIATNGAIDLKFAAGAGQYAATGFRIYRSNKAAASNATSTFYPLFDVSVAQVAIGVNGGGAGVVRDLNRYLPNTSCALILEKDLEVYSYKQLAPLMKMDLALLGPAYRFMVLMYGTPIVYAPKKLVKIINIGSTAPSA